MPCHVMPCHAIPWPVPTQPSPPLGLRPSHIRSEGAVEGPKERLARLRAAAQRMEAVTARAGRMTQVRGLVFGLCWARVRHVVWLS